MPVIEAHILGGYAEEEKFRLTSAITDAVRFVVPAPDDAITVLLHEYPADAYARGGTRRRPAPALPDPSRVVVDYLAAMESRDLATAGAMLGEGFQMVFPGNQVMTSLGELVDWAKGRYRFVTKTYEAVEAYHHGGHAVVYARGTLAGDWPDGTAFEGVRFIDRFEVSGGKIVRQEVWNDIAEMRAQ